MDKYESKYKEIQQIARQLKNLNDDLAYIIVDNNDVFSGCDDGDIPYAVIFTAGVLPMEMMIINMKKICSHLLYTELIRSKQKND